MAANAAAAVTALLDGATALLRAATHPAHIHQIHVLLLVSGHLHDSSPHLLLLLLHAASRLRPSPCLHPLAHHLLDQIPHPSPPLFFAAVRLASHLRLSRLALRHYLALRARHPALLPPAPALAAVLKSLPGRAAHAHALRLTTSHNSRFVQNTLVAMYFASGDARRARTVFDAMRDRDVVSWTSAISGLAQNGNPLEALQLLRTMRADGDVRPDFVVLVSAVKAYMDVEDLASARSVHSLVIKGGFDNEQDLVVTLTAMYAKFGCVEVARSLFDRVPSPGLILWNAIISGYSKNCLANEAVELFKRMIARKMRPDSITIRSVILACSQLGSIKLATWMEDYVRRSEYKDDILVKTALIDMFAKSGSIAHARAAFERMREKDVVVWSALIAGYGMHGHVSEAIALFEDMKQARVEPNDVTFVGLLSACNHAGFVEEGWNYFHSMKDYGIEPRHQHYACVVDLLARAGHVERAYQFILDMPIKPEISVWGALLHACKIHGHLSLAERSAKHIFDLEPSNAGHYVQLANIYASAGMWSDVSTVRVMMKERGVTKATGCSLIEIDGKLHSFHVWDNSHPRSPEIFALLYEIERKLKESGRDPEADLFLYGDC